jgi:hypothetical protein
MKTETLFNMAPQEKNDSSYNYYDLTPVEKHGDFWFKRDDTYKPFEDFRISGGKVRQCLFLVESNLDNIISNFGGCIATAASVYSPQATIVARVAAEFGLGCIIGHGAKTPLKYPAMKMCADYGAELVQLCDKYAYNNVLKSNLEKLRAKHPFFTINFGYQVTTNPEAIIEMNARQAQNLPDDLDMLVINVGSGVSGAGIIHGIQKYKPYLIERGKVHFVQPFGYDRSDVISSAVEFPTPFHYHKGNYPYHKPLNADPSPQLHLDEIYESKAYDFMVKNLDWKDRKVLYWLIGDSNVLREKA